MWSNVILSVSISTDVRNIFWIDSTNINFTSTQDNEEETTTLQCQILIRHTLNCSFFTEIVCQTKGRFMCLSDICIFSLALTWMCTGTVSTNSNTAGRLREIHLPSLGMPKWLWRCNSLILSSEQCSSYCYGKSMWLSWRAASTSFSWGTVEHSFNLCKQYFHVKEKKKIKNTSHNVSCT